MALIISKLYDKKRERDVTMGDVDMSKVDFNFETADAKVYSYVPHSNPAGDHNYFSSQVVFNGDVEEVPVFKKENGVIKTDNKELADYLVENFGSGQYNVFKRGGTPCWDPYFENRFVEAKESKE